MIGHTMGAAGAIETMATVLSIRDGRVHPTINQETARSGLRSRLRAKSGPRVDIRIALKNSFGLGGQNACLVLARWEE